MKYPDCYYKYTGDDFKYDEKQVYEREYLNSKYWKCKRCYAVFTSDNKKCKCILNPSPWEPISELQYKIELELNEINERTKRI